MVIVCFARILAVSIKWLRNAACILSITINNILWSVLNNTRISILAYHIYFYSYILQHKSIWKGHLGI